ncbi:MAG TPA: hypothetical protein VHD60_01640 [Candidatus Saccharimonadales bacterium]|nr:hypothetical protein [Candidatus Saccharimonadales bacterium]
MAKPIDTLLQKEMSRKEFMTTVGFGVASLLGFSTVLRLLGHGSKLQQSGRGYSSGAYGK